MDLCGAAARSEHETKQHTCKEHTRASVRKYFSAHGGERHTFDPVQPLGWRMRGHEQRAERGDDVCAALRVLKGA